MSLPTASDPAPHPPAPSDTATAGPGLASDVRHATRSALQLGLGLLGSWLIGMAIRFALPRWLGPEQFGVLQFAEVFATTAMIVTTLGSDTYIRKEVATRPEHATEFFGGTLFIGTLVGIVVLALALPTLSHFGKSADVLWIVGWVAVAQILANINSLYAALLHAVGAVGGLASLNVVAKVVWALGIVVAIRAGAGLTGIAQALLVSEVVRGAVLVRLGRQHVDLTLRVDLAATARMMRLSLPFFVAGVAQTIYARIDVSILSFLANDTEVGWYGAASTIAGLSLLLSPIIAWVLLPLSSRAAARSEADLLEVSRQAMAFVLIIAVPASLGIFLAADELIHLAFGDAFAPAAASLRIIAPTFLLTYLAMVSASLLVRLDRAWTVTWISLGGMLISPTLNLLFVPRFAAHFGTGGAGLGSATALTLTECFTAGAMTWTLRSRAFDGPRLRLIGTTMLLALGIVALDHLLRPLGIWRLPLDAAAYVAAGIALRIIHVPTLIDLVRGALARRAPVEAT
ncbi:MAG TPA: flippase [Gemmatimonadaceae bacterium]|nr:flippase [Gemmatimonadaceae bacterium]